MSQFPNPDTQFKPGQSGNPSGKPKGTLHLSTHIQNMLNDPDFEAEFIDAKGKKVEFKGHPIKAIIQTAVIKAKSGDKNWADWLANNGYGTKQIIEVNDPRKEILDKYMDNKNAGQTQET